MHWAGLVSLLYLILILSSLLLSRPNPLVKVDLFLSYSKFSMKMHLVLIILKVSNPSPILSFYRILFLASLSTMSLLLLLLFTQHLLYQGASNSHIHECWKVFGRYFDATLIISNTVFVCNTDITGDLLSCLSYSMWLWVGKQTSLKCKFLLWIKPISHHYNKI